MSSESIVFTPFFLPHGFMTLKLQTRKSALAPIPCRELNFTVFQKVYLPSNLTFFTNYPITSGSKQDDAHFENKKVEKLGRVKTCNSVKGNYEKSSRL